MILSPASATRRTLHRWAAFSAVIAFTLLYAYSSHSTRVELAYLMVPVTGIVVVRGAVRRSRSTWRAIQLARREHRLFKAAAESSGQAFFTCAPVCDSIGRLVDFNVTYVNSAAEALFGRSRIDLIGGSTRLIIPQSAKLRVFSGWSRVAATGAAETLEITFTGNIADNLVQQTFFSEARVIPHAGGVAVTILSAQQEQHATQRMQQMHDFTQSIIESAPVSMIATDTSGRIVAMNSAAERLTLYSKEEMVGKLSITQLHDPSELLERSLRLNNALEPDAPFQPGLDSLITLPSQGQPEEREWTYLRKDGSRIWVNLTMSALQTGDGKTTGYLGIAFDVTERKELVDSVVHVALHDQLTGLPNRALFQDRVSQAIERGARFDERLAVFLIDIDHFKRINDSLGHASGDLLLSWIARQLSTVVRKSDTVARVGGDEFAILMPNIQSPEDAERCAALILQKISTPNTIGNREVRVTASIGFCLYPEGALDATDLIANADTAMYEAKAAGRANSQAYSNAMERATADRLDMEEDLRYALENNELRLHYQPLILCATGEVVGMEMLLRWHSPKRGVVPPDVFIPVAEESGLLVGIGEWAIAKGCHDCAAVARAVGKPLSLAVNLSPLQFSQKNLATVVKQALEDSGLAPSNFEIEITEQLLMTNTPSILSSLEQMHDLGVNIAIDDFGTGFSSFSYILQYQVDRLKIDRSFIARATTDPAAAAIVRTIIAMAHGLRIDVVAEGVETNEHLDFLMRKRCDVVQGYLFSPAVPLEDFPAAVDKIEDWVASQREIAARALEAKSQRNATQYAATERSSERRSGTHAAQTLPANVESWQATMIAN